MPQPPLRDPPRLAARLRGLAVAVPTAVVLFATLLLFNIFQTLTLAVCPFSKRLFRRLNRFAADTWWGWCVIAGQRLYGVRIVVSGDAVPARENAIVFANHQQMTDVTYLMFLAREKGRLGDLKWIVKDIVKYVPGVGWGMAFLGCLFVKRDWAADRRSVERTFARLTENHVPMWLVSFPEGTRLTPTKLLRSQAFAARAGLPPLAHVLLPRTKGFVASALGLAGHVTAVYDVTMGYPEGVPSLWQYVKGFARRAHVHVRRFSLSELPKDADALAAWLQERYREKDALLQRFYERGTFAEG